VRELAGAKVNIIWGTVTQQDYDVDKIVVTLIATGMSKGISEEKNKQPTGVKVDNNVKLREIKYPSAKKEIELEIPAFLCEARNKRKSLI
jgi:cell division GTPase FtsZ